jgi:6-phosphofructokinase 1
MICKQFSACQYLLKQSQQGKSFSVVVVAEGALSREEAGMDKKARKKYRERVMKSSIGHWVAQEIQAETGMETRTTVLGYVQRGGIPSASDRFLATNLGVGAVDLLERREYGKMVVCEHNKISSVELKVPAGKVRSIPQDHYMLNTALSLGICLGQWDG